MRFLNILAFFTLFIAGTARADHYFVFPEIGVGYGWAQLSKDAAQPIGQLDLHLGTEWDKGPTTAIGWMANIGYAASVAHDPPEKWQRFQFAPMLTASAGYNWWTAFARVGVGPHLAVTKRENETAVGGGGQLEAAVGFKNAIELYSQAFLTVDPRSTSSTFMVGVRLNAIAFLVTLDLFSDYSPSYSEPHQHNHGHHAEPPPKHRAVPAD